MDLIGSINYIENRLGGRKPNQDRGKPAPKTPRNNAVDGQHTQTDSSHSATEPDARIGQKIDIIA